MVGDPGPLAGSTIPGLLRAQIANPGIPNLSLNTRVSTLTTNVDFIAPFLEKLDLKQILTCEFSGLLLKRFFGTWYCPWE